MQTWRHSSSVGLLLKHMLPQGMLVREQSTQAFVSSPAEGRVLTVVSAGPGAVGQQAALPTPLPGASDCFRLVSKAFSHNNTKAHSWIQILVGVQQSIWSLTFISPFYSSHLTSGIPPEKNILPPTTKKNKTPHQKNINLDKSKCPPTGGKLRNYLMKYYMDMKNGVYKVCNSKGKYSSQLLMRKPAATLYIYIYIWYDLNYIKIAWEKIN